MTTRTQGAYLDAKIVGVDVASLHRTRRSKYRRQLRDALDTLPEWADDCRLYVSERLRSRLQLRHASTQCWITASRLRYTEAVARNLSLGLWVSVDETEDRLNYTCKHGFSGSRKCVYTSPPKSSVMLGSCPECLKLSARPVFGTLKRKQARWAGGLDNPETPCVLYVHQVRDGSYIYGVSTLARLQHRMDQYKASMGYAPTILHQVTGTEIHMWYAEELLKKGITKGLRHTCEAATIEGGRTEYLPAYYSVARVVELLDEAVEITEEIPEIVRP